MTEAYHDESLAVRLRSLVYTLPDMNTKGQRNQLRDKILRLASRIEKMQSSMEELEKARIKAEAQVVFLENVEKKRQGDTSRRVKYTRAWERDKANP